MTKKKENVKLNLFKSYFKNINEVICFSVRTIWEVKRRYFFYLYIEIVVCAIIPFIDILGIKWFINEIISSERSINNLVAVAAFIVIGKFLSNSLTKFSRDKKNICIDKIDRKVKTNINDVSMHIKFEDTEDPVVLDQLKLAMKSYEQVGIRAIGEFIFSVISGIIILIGVAYIIINCSLILFVVIICDFILSAKINEKIVNIYYKYFPLTTDRERGVDYITNKLPSYQYGKEIRIYNAIELILKKQKEMTDSIVEIRKEQNCKIRSVSSTWDIIHNGLTGIMYIILAYETIKDKITLGDFSSIASATSTFNTALNSLVGAFVNFNVQTKQMLTVIEYLKRANEQDNGRQNMKDIKGVTIEFRNVSFKYPRSDEFTLKNINLTIESGERIAIVGENGAGKTTFIKLLCRLYNVTEGEILVNGKSINDYKFEEYVKILSVVFQDFKLLAFSIRENIIGNDNKDMDEVLMDMCETCGVANMVNKTSKKLGTSLYKMFEEDGIVPSGGEAQKLAIVRALYKNAPVVILDEPTATLDPISEHEIYQYFNTLVENRTAIYISHRLSSCKFCDKIVVLVDKCIKEIGSHEELVNANGVYANMYNVQSQYYK